MAGGFWAKLAATLGVIATAAQPSCTTHEHPPLLGFVQADAGSDASGDDDPKGGLNVGDASSEPALCGDQKIPAISDPPNLYFVVDRSGSMADPLSGSPYSKYENARIAIAVMLRAVGHRVRYAAAVYPALLNEEGCAPGQAIFPITAGDSPKYAAKNQNGPALTELLSRLGRNPPSGGTPTAATLRELEPTITALKGKKTYVVLITDGAPNCNLALRCGVEACIPNIEHLTLSGVTCDESFNCCAPRVGAGDCVDADDSEAAVADYQAAGIDTFVVGMPGSEAYRGVLNRLSSAGNTARPGNTQYYAVSDTDQLTVALHSIGAQVALQCDLPLSEAPENPELVNVYFDDRVVPKSDEDGWHYSDGQSIQFVGPTCETLLAGDVLNVQVLSGCPTVVR